MISSAINYCSRETISHVVKDIEIKQKVNVLRLIDDCVSRFILFRYVRIESTSLLLASADAIINGEKGKCIIRLHIFHISADNDGYLLHSHKLRSRIADTDLADCYERHDRVTK